MLTPTIKTKVNDLWDKFWSSGISNPLNAIEQITYLLFIKQLDENDTRRITNNKVTGNSYKSIFSGTYLPQGLEPTKENKIKKEDLRWKNVNQGSPEEIYRKMQTLVFPFIKDLGETDSYFAKHMANAVFLIPKASLLKDAMDTIDAIYSQIEKEDRFIDTQGDVYEYLLNQLSQAGKNGQFRTPTHIIELLVELVDPKLEDRIADPACGSAGFLLAALKYIITQHTSKEYQSADENGFLRGVMGDDLSDSNKDKLQKDTLYGFDIDPTMVRLGLMNLIMHGIENPKVDYKDTLSKFYEEDDFYTTVLANPPFTGSLDKSEINPTFTIDTKKTELLFIERIYKMLKKDGTAGLIVPQGVLFGGSKAFVDTRKILVEKCELKAVIAMPSGVFKPYAGVATAILIFTKGGKTKNVWFYDMKSDGRSLDDKRIELTDSKGKRDFGDLPKIIEEYKKNKKNTDKTQSHFIVSKKEIIENGYDLSINKYKEDVYEKIEFEDPKIIFKRLTDTEDDIFKGINELKKLIQ
ncbi:MAG: N-6 DNA methylase [Bacteroidia bacterium]